MRTTSFASIAIALAFALGALPASAEHRSHGQREDSSVELAGRLSAAAHELYHHAAKGGHRHGASQRGAVLALAAVDRQAREVQNEVRRHGLLDRRTRHEVRELQVALHRAEGRLAALHRGRDVRRGFARVEALAQRLDARIAKLEEDQRGRHRERYAYQRGRRDPFARLIWSFGFRY